ncbi:hypothetical protein CPC08DRAFT_663031 [Agrocybe pediades]|nr:hypothetical protein CPC08DRAFT_663031 [Agrocybe pediades]
MPVSAIELLESQLPEELTSGITGNTSREIKELPIKWLSIFRDQGTGFAGSISSRLKLVDISVVPNPDDPSLTEGKVICEIDVTPDMCNAQGVMDNGCVMYFMDECSSLGVIVLNGYLENGVFPGVSQNINTFFHSSALEGTKLRVVGTSVASDEDIGVGKCEVWDADNHRLIASGTHRTMAPSGPRE